MILIGYFKHRLQFNFVPFILSPLLCTQWSLWDRPRFSIQGPGFWFFFPRFPQIQFHYLTLFLHEKDSFEQSFRAPYTLSKAPVRTVASPELASVFVPRAGALSLSGTVVLVSGAGFSARPGLRHFLAPHFLVGYNKVRMGTFSHGDSCR